MKPILVHVFDEFDRGGTELGILTLIRLGFYQDVDLYIVGITDGHKSSYEEFKSLLGDEHVTCLLPQKMFAHSSSSTFWIAPFLLAKAFKRIKPQTAVLSLGAANQAGRWAGWFNPDLKIISFEHFTEHAPILNWFLRQTAQRVDTVFADCPESARAAMARYKGKCSVDTPAYCVPLTILEPNITRSVHQPAIFKLLSIGRFEKQKNFPRLIRAVAELTESGRAVELTLIGEGPQRDQLRALARELKIGDRVHMPGFLTDREKLKEAFDEADIYVQPSLHEGFCLAVAEALASGIPTVASDVGGIRDYGQHGRNMIKLEGPAQKDILTGLKSLIDNYEECAPQLTQAALDTAHALFSEKAVRRQWEEAKLSFTSPRPHSSDRFPVLHTPRFLQFSR